MWGGLGARGRVVVRVPVFIHLLFRSLVLSAAQGRDGPPPYQGDQPSTMSTCQLSIRAESPEPRRRAESPSTPPRARRQLLTPGAPRRQERGKIEPDVELVVSYGLGGARLELPRRPESVKDLKSLADQALVAAGVLRPKTLFFQDRVFLVCGDDLLDEQLPVLQDVLEVQVMVNAEAVEEDLQAAQPF